MDATRWLVLAVASGLGLAGCLSPAQDPSLLDPPGERGGPAPGVPDAVTQQGCDAVHARFPVPMDEARAAMPPGFHPVPFDPSGATATLLVRAHACDATLPAELAQDPVRVFAVLLPVAPPASLRAPGAEEHALLLTLRASNERFAGVFASWGLADARPVPVIFEEGTSAVQPLWARQAQVRADDPSGPLELRVASGGPLASFPATAARWFLVAGGGVAGVVDVAASAADGIDTGSGAFLALGDAPRPMPAPVDPGEVRQAWGDGYGFAFAYRGRPAA